MAKMQTTIKRKMHWGVNWTFGSFLGFIAVEGYWMSTSARMHTSRVCVTAISPFEERKFIIWIWNFSCNFMHETFHATEHDQESFPAETRKRQVMWNLPSLFQGTLLKIAFHLWEAQGQDWVWGKGSSHSQSCQRPLQGPQYMYDVILGSSKQSRGHYPAHAWNNAIKIFIVIWSFLRWQKSPNRISSDKTLSYPVVPSRKSLRRLWSRWFAFGYTSIWDRHPDLTLDRVFNTENTVPGAQQNSTNVEGKMSNKLSEN